MPETLKSLIDKFNELFLGPLELPPHRSHDHLIHLIPSLNHANIKPYRYPHHHKTQIEKMIDEMLTSEIID